MCINKYQARIFILFLFFVSLVSVNELRAQATDNLLSNDPQVLARGIGHYEKAHSLLLAAIREFDEGYKIVNTDEVLDGKRWKASLVERAKELQTVLAPQAREIKVGSRYGADSRLIGIDKKSK